MFAKFGALCLLLLLQATLGPAQLITLKDGKVGVNFAGYHADAGLGGLLTGNSAHGGLSASAGTPWGSRAAAGLGGGLDGRTAGGAYAAAQANDDVGASAVLGGTVGQRGYIGAEAHRPGKVSGSSAHLTPQYATSAPVSIQDQPAALPTHSTYVQRVKPPKKYSLIAPSQAAAKNTYKTAVQRPQIQNHVIAPQAQNTVVGSALEIPIGILRSLQFSLGNLVNGGQPAPQAPILPYQG
ncbi:uncharacterized protein LOC117784503 [Drosophila innubila]|uniref:uncharacterized protein LOC117784503 n=1 Tax=Drosophila innubila TaxID=198719 RepID=UPI00148E409C|nr:uncharacterized protein LOC117784503 [Drosophila innubila]XP_034478145.1 uncharacterized protein LOC117784503 [Drosophila innubila]